MRILFKLNKKNQQRQHEKLTWIFPIKLAMYATYLRDQGHEVLWDVDDEDPKIVMSEVYDQVIISESQIDVPFLDLPHADRVLTDAKNPKWQSNGNFKYRPGTYILSSSGCSWGKCEFCIEKNVKHKHTRKPSDVVSEIDECIKLGFKEVFCDSGTFPTGLWLSSFCEQMMRKKRDVHISANMRAIDIDYKMMKDAGFRMLLFGLESANQSTLNRLNKGIKADEIIKDIKKAADAGLEPHIAVMFGYAWESKKEELETLKLVHYLLRKGYAKTAQASVYTPRNGSSSGGVISGKPSPKDIYKIAYHPEFWFNQLKDIKNKDDLKYLWLKIKEGLRAKSV